jgi:hypothetical protein
MIIENGPRPTFHRSSVRGGMFGIQRLAAAVFRVFISMPRLTELVSTEDGFCYKHAAPDGASVGFIPLKTAKTPHFDCNSLSQ